MTSNTPTPSMDERIEAIAILLWHRFAPESHIEWEDEIHKGEYRSVAADVLAALSQAPNDQVGEACQHRTRVGRSWVHPHDCPFCQTPPKVSIPDVEAVELREMFDLVCGLMQEAKGAEGPSGGYVTDHLDLAEHWLDKIEAATGGQTP